MPSILLVDDETMILTALSRELRATGYRVDTCAMSMDALPLLEQKAYDAVICDYQMPRLNGIELLKHVRDYHPHTARLMLTGKADLNAAMAAVNEAGACRFITKPWNSAKLVADLAGAISDRKRNKADKALASAVRAKWNKERRSANEMSRLRQSNPALTQVERDPDGAVVLKVD